MKKEEVLALSKELVLSVRDSRNKILTPEEAANRRAKIELLNREVANLNSCDMLWLDDEYGKFYRKEISPNFKKNT